MTRIPSPLALAAASAVISLFPVPSKAQNMSDLDYPETRAEDVSETRFGTVVEDPYRWLENDVREDEEVAAWVAAQNKVTQAYLSDLPGRETFAKRLRALIDYERYSLPEAAGGRTIFTYNPGLLNQPRLMTQGPDDAEAKVLLDPNDWSEDDTVALGGYALSPDGAKLVYAEQDGGSDWRTVKVVDAATGRTTSDIVEWVKFSNLSWDGSGDGFFYSRFARPEQGQEFQSLNLDQKVYYHRLGTPQSDDRLVYETPAEPKLSHTAQTTHDGRYLIIYSSEGTDERYQVHVIDLASDDLAPVTLIGARENNWAYAGNRGSEIYFLTNLDAPRQRVVRLDMSDPAAQPVQIVGQDDAVLEQAALKRDTLVLAYLSDVKSELRTFALDGTPLGAVDLPGIGQAYLGGEEGDGELFYGFTSFTVPPRIYRYDVEAKASEIWREPDVPFDPDAFVAEQQFYTSKDGTRVPMFVVRRADLDSGKPAPTLLYGYGGFNVSVLPAFSTTRLAWIEQGGVVAIANIRGGGEYGKAWHDAGRLQNKQNVFDDFIAAAEHLIETGVTSSEQLAIQGGSNGGLLVGAVTNQRPDLFAAALPAVGVMDMVRFDQFTAGRYWVDDYGYPDREADFKTLYAYSPYHNIGGDTDYPAILVTTADTDDRVVPGHSFKYTAALQAAEIGPDPHLIRIETRAGHGSGKPVDKVIEEYADVWAFAAAHTGLAVGDGE
ncbi:S9 family peptidase [Pacificimonas flava]|uniref:prolyl oligopeptidase n=2 Tax=Pacificimonas TaxID=1960290 RepID=A0A219B639_9SPHN|nr:MULTISPECIES: prolyl oligopeptidase family serine peptidase [Pacificimonas]MBZ6379114.1 S9 family peptidase [Pacificimonas aurantium]OWV33654.1 S9 family peptidase [Pacificimonas flava]